MANGPGDYRDPKVTTTDRSSSMSWLWYVLGAIVLLLLLAWLLGWFGSEVADEVGTDAAVVEETDSTVVITEPAGEAVDEAAAAEEALETDAGDEQIVTEGGEPIVTQDGDPVVTEGAAD